MADLKISQLTALTSIDAVAADVLPIVDSSAATTKKIGLGDVAEHVANSAVLAGVIAAAIAAIPAPTVDFTSDQSVLANAIFG